MRRKLGLCTFLALLLCSFTTTSRSFAEDWPQWRGPNRDGISKEKSLLKKWPKEGPKLLWQVKELGDGYSTPAIVGDRLYLISNKGTDNEFVHALSVKNGQQIWETKLGTVGPNDGPQYPGARSTPTVDDKLTFALGSNGDLACLETESGKVVWQKNLRDDFGGKFGKWAYAESPLVDGDALICTPGGSEATIVALKKSDGSVIWKSALPEGDDAAYSSIITVEAAGKKQYVQFLEKGLVGVDSKTGKFLWRYEKTAKGSPANIPTPVAMDNLIYSSTGRGGGGSVQLSASGDGIEATEAYFATKLPKDIGGAVLVDGYLYGSSGGLMCVDFKTGDIKWQERGIGAASVLYADGRLYLHGENNDVAMVEANPKEYRELGRVTPPDQPDRGKSKAWSYPALASGCLYIHDAGSIWCYDVKGDTRVATVKTGEKVEKADDDGKQLFNGKDLDSWQHVGPGRFVVEDGVMKTDDGMGLLWYEREKLGNCVIRVVYKQEKPGSNSGVYIRIADKPDDPWFAVHNGYEVQIAGGTNPYRMTASVYSFGKATANPAKPPGEWNTLEITLDGKLVKTVLNGTPVTNFDPASTPPPRENAPTYDDPHLGPRPEKGYIGLQNHDKNSIVHFKEVSVRPLSAKKAD